MKLDGNEKKEEIRNSELESGLCESKDGLPHTASDRTNNETNELRNEATELRTTTSAVAELQRHSPPRVCDP